MIDKHPLYPTAASISSAINALADRLGGAGCKVAHQSVRLPNLALTSIVYRELLSAFFSIDLPPGTRAGVGAAAEALSLGDHSLAAANLRGLTISHVDWIRQSRIRNGLRAHWQELFGDVDVMLCPPMPTVAFLHDHSEPMYRRTLYIDGQKARYADQSVWAGIATLNGLPATTMPISHSESGLPIGVQIVGNYLEDRQTSHREGRRLRPGVPRTQFHDLQKRGHIVGMTGDGVNDAPALKKADCGIAVSGATDAARAAAAIVLMTPGLSVIIDAIKESRRIFQRMNSYAIYRIAETLRVLLFMTLAILIFNFYPLTAVMIVMLALLNDGAILSIAYDNVHYKDEPEAWNMRLVLGIATVLGVVGPSPRLVCFS